ncbi:BTB/POZ domain-containing protein KCTD6 [Holothuria leucospilota]|uniref:BTB/POZ domain-containing protein KCTD6 n=1 Tax=Holothuria leucospilota TaxID=206669 RepID=A0A9Q0YSH2_HOLLE|nr:BTB/POZ domain-containing protein KCTD6 [Holothuria leucospilota]
MESESHKTPNLPQGYVRLDVGGNFYTTSLSTLTRYPNSMLYNMFTQDNIPLAQDKDGRYIIDRDGAVFRYILNFLRGGNLNLPPGFTEYDQLQEEVDFYQLDEMKELLRLWKQVVNVMRADSDRLSRFRSMKSPVKVNVRDKEFHLQRNSFAERSGYNQQLLRMIKQAPVTDKRETSAFGNNECRFRDGTVDCDPTSFQYILNFLTKKGSYIPKNQVELENLKTAVHRYGLRDMKTVLDQQIYDASNNDYLMLQT